MWREGDECATSKQVNKEHTIKKKKKREAARNEENKAGAGNAGGGQTCDASKRA